MGRWRLNGVGNDYCFANSFIQKYWTYKQTNFIKLSTREPIILYKLRWESIQLAYVISSSDTTEKNLWEILWFCSAIYILRKSGGDLWAPFTFEEKMFLIYNVVTRGRWGHLETFPKSISTPWRFVIIVPPSDLSLENVWPMDIGNQKLAKSQSNCNLFNTAGLHLIKSEVCALAKTNLILAILA